MNFKKSAFFALLLGACSLPLNAQTQTSTAILTINGKIIPVSCTLSDFGNRDFQMDHKDISLLTGVNTIIDGGVTKEISLSCPRTSTVYMTIKDNIQTSNNTFKFLVGRNSLQANQTTHARGVGVQLKFFEGGNEITSVNDKNIGSKNVLFTGTGTDYATKATRTVTIRPYYYQFSGTVTPGIVYAEATLELEYN